ncbi:hypothetical protein Q9251_02870 [Alkalihalobacillus macyae]|nr:hypothetical protein [Alkalihalobacillus macyae]MDP4549817.1 hypothetical protein [Alkalihalobacillus macyae]
MEPKVIKRKGITIIDTIGEGVDAEKLFSEQAIDTILKYINEKYRSDNKS